MAVKYPNHKHIKAVDRAIAIYRAVEDNPTF
jgi:hypothetical protein